MAFRSIFVGDLCRLKPGLLAYDDKVIIFTKEIKDCVPGLFYGYEIYRTRDKFIFFAGRDLFLILEITNTSPSCYRFKILKNYKEIGYICLFEEDVDLAVEILA